MSPNILSRRARADVREIWNYTAEDWNNEQTDRYIRKLHRVIEASRGTQRKAVAATIFGKDTASIQSARM